MGYPAYVCATFGAFYWIKFLENTIQLPLRPIFTDKKGNVFLAKLSGKLRISQTIKSQRKKEHPVAVGDYVSVEVTEGKDFAVITEIKNRKNQFCRASHERNQVLAANIDQVLLILSFNQPPFNPKFADRVICESEISKIPIILAINKKDLLVNLSKEKQNELFDFQSLYQKLRYPVFQESFKLGLSTELEKKLEGKRTLFLGQSGVGKSTLLNILAKEYVQKVDQEQIKYKGRHTTVNSVLYAINPHTEIIDVPGMREFGLNHRSLAELSRAFVEFQNYSCRFENCLHHKEEGCAIKEAVKKQEISQHRYDSYLDILQSHFELFKPRRGDYWRGIRR